MSRRDPTIYDDDAQTEIKLPTRWEICGSCNGEGTTSRHVECDGGGFTGSEWADLDDDFKDDYLAGRFDRACDECSGSGKVKVPDFDRLTPEQRAAWEEQEDERAECDAIQRAEIAAEQAFARRLGY